MMQEFIKNVHLCLCDPLLPINNPIVELAIKNVAENNILQMDKFEGSCGGINSFKEGIDQTLAANKKYMLYAELGAWFNIYEAFVNAIYDQLSEDYKFIGHVLDYRNGGSFYIHTQMFIIDAEWARDNNIDEISPINPSVEWTGHLIERSKENYHDDYTPLWTKGTNKLKHFKGRGTGWNIIEKLCETNAKFSPWNENVRKRKSFIYPYSNSYRKSVSKILETSHKLFTFLANTEPIDNSVVDGFQHIETLILPASGPNTFIYPFLFKSLKNIIVYDKNRLSLGVFNNCWQNWNGTNYNKFMKDNWSVHDLEFYYGGDRLSEENNRIEHLGIEWKNWWDNRHNLNMHFVYMDLFNKSTWFTKQKSKKFFPTPSPALVMVSNILAYQNSSIWTNTQEKFNHLWHFESRLKKYLGENNVNFYGFNPIGNKWFYGPLPKFKYNDFSIIHNLPWNKN